ncbi:hypothetical protein C7974DRAFT_379998 [Boeremia exigua]|uniref:uncharacterized protein n=1 Tax=Boeremia exigua TaxID=749465 RepID=UPI001E8D5DD5|nr:uncharacterized protein C7974DRAFT_379998 [Boeremia exigua]KAH6615126.1 hypothetical protein C7974DRAFT_379998 [Boeremia exigua]
MEPTAIRASTGASSTRPTQQDGSIITQETECLFAIMKNGRVLLFAMRIWPTQTGATIMQLLKKEYNASASTQRWFATRVVIEDAVISPLCIGECEAQDYPREVIVESSTPREDLAEAFITPSILRGSAFVSLNGQFITGQTVGTRPCHAILIKKTVCKITVAVVLLMAILLSVTFGCVAGFWTGDAKIGLALACKAEPKVCEPCRNQPSTAPSISRLSYRWQITQHAVLMVSLLRDPMAALPSVGYGAAEVRPNDQRGWLPTHTHKSTCSS